MCRNKIVIAVVIALMAAVPLAALMFGRYPVPLADVIGSLCPMLGLDVSDMSRNIVVNIRLPRVLLAMAAGAGLAVAGAAFQAVFSNPLATPDTLGVATGASFGAVLAILAGLPVFAVQFASLAAGLAAAAIVIFVSRVRGSSPVIMMILAGMVTGALFSALVSLVKFAADPQDVLPSVTFWLLGSLSGTTFSTLAIGTPLIIAGTFTLFLYRWRLNSMTLSNDEATSLGINVRHTRFAIITAAAAITASVVSMCGLIGWVGVLIPHASRMIFGNDNRAVIPASAALGAVFMLIIDTIARSVTEAEIPASILTAVIGAPFFIILLRRTGGIRE
ncbi:MAG: iron ABC transporter permease [Synergistes sp.]|nr:iron ABC transporter permease [Synergistes sp.]